LPANFSLPFLHQAPPTHFDNYQNKVLFGGGLSGGPKQQGFSFLAAMPPKKKNMLFRTRCELSKNSDFFTLRHYEILTLLLALFFGLYPRYLLSAQYAGKNFPYFYK